MSNREQIIGLTLINEVQEPIKPKVIDTFNGRPVIDAELMKSETINRNIRLYRTGETKEQVYGDRFKELIKRKSLVGEAGHPITNNIIRQGSIDPKCISHNILDIWMDDNTVYGKIVGLENEHGRLFTSMIKDGSELAFSLRAVGFMVKSNDGKYIIVKKPKFITFDWVFYPSFPTAYQRSVLTESGILLPSENGVLNPVLENGNRFIVDNKYDGCIAYESVSESLDNEVVKYLKDKSGTMKSIMNQMNVNESSFMLIGDHLVFSNMDGSAKSKVVLEAEIKDEILDYFGRI